jgi:CP family cyanate transporter-like MFS transporter
MPASPSRRSPSSLLLVAVLAAAANMRIGIVEVGPVVEDIRHDVGISSAMAGALTTIPFLCCGVFAFAGGNVVRRIGTASTIRLSLLLVCAGTVVRAVAPGTLLLLLATLPVGIGIAWLGIAIAIIVKSEFADRAGTLTGWYIAAMSAAAALTAVLVVPLRDLTGSWRWAFTISALPALAALVLWLLPKIEAPPAEAEERQVRAARPDRRGAVTLALIFGLQSICFSTMIGWVAAIYREEGWSDSAAGLATTSIPVLTVVASLLVPVISRRDTRRSWIFRTALVMATSLVLIAVIPTFAAPLWLLMFGLASGAIFPLVMTVPLDLVEHPSDVGVLTAWMLGLGYLISGAGPTVAGALRDLSGSFEVPLLLIAGLAVTAGLLARSPLLDRLGDGSR